jgi:uncharacterized RDD family membrane protein YckC
MTTNENPYAPPSQEAELASIDEAEEAPLRVARRSARFVNALADSGCTLAMSFAVEGMFGEAVGGAVSIIFSVLYWPVFELVFNKTPGKWLTSTRVVAEDGGRPNGKQILIRSLVRWIPFEALSFVRKRRPVGWHDRWSGTRVVDDAE